MNFIIFVIAAIAALVGGYQFVKHYEEMDCYFFNKTEAHYESFGIMQVFACGVFGALAVFLPLLQWMFTTNWNMESINSALILYVIMAFSYNLYEAIVKMSSAGAMIGKFVFLTLACVVGGLVGALGSVVIIGLITLYLLALLFSAVLKGDSQSSKKRTVLDDGTELKNEKGICGEDNYSDSSGNTWDRSGDTFTRR